MMRKMSTTTVRCRCRYKQNRRRGKPRETLIDSTSSNPSASTSSDITNSFDDSDMCTDEMSDSDDQLPVYKRSNKKQTEFSTSHRKTSRRSWRSIIFNIILILGFLTQPGNAIVELRCGSIDIRNKPDFFVSFGKDLTTTIGDPETVVQSQRVPPNTQINCTIVEGSFLMAFIFGTDHETRQELYPRFPYLREITGTVLIFGATGLKSLSWVLPNLRVIGGQVLVQHYSLIIYQNPNLTNIGLENLRVIRNGGVRITDNKLLCYSKTIDYKSMIMSKVNDVLLDDAAENNIAETGQLCPKGDCEHDPDQTKCRYMEWNEGHVQSCWNSTTCQKVCKYDRIGDSHEFGPGCDSMGRKCDDQCLGGCDVPGDPRACHACRNFHYQGRCVPKCADNLYVLLKRRCVTKEKCLSLNPKKRNTALQIRATNGLCSDKCPEGYEDDPNNPTECKKCETECQITCQGNVTVDSYSKALQLKGCHIIDGYLTIEMREATDSGVASEIGEVFSKIHTIKGYLIINRSKTFLSLTMFKSLRLIQGQILHSDKYALSVIDNANLKKLFDANQNLKIERGFLQFHNNRMLCFRHIEELMSSMNRTAEMSDNDQSASSNGDKAICEDSSFEVEVEEVTDNRIFLKWRAFNTTEIDHRKFLGYDIYFKETDKVDYSLSIDDNRSACSDSWNSKFIEAKPDETNQFITASLSEGLIKPYTTYAFYVVTQMVHHKGAQNAISKVGFATTTFAVPDPPIVTVRRVLSDTIELQWEPPTRPNGVITHYEIIWREIEVDLVSKAQIFCATDPLSHHTQPDITPVDESDDKVSTSPAPTLMAAAARAGEQGTCSSMMGCCECPKSYNIEKTEETAEFENSLQDVVFVQSCDFDYDPVRCAYWAPEQEEIPPDMAENEKLKSKRSIERSKAWEDRRKKMYEALHAIRNTYKDYEAYSALIMNVRRKRSINGKTKTREDFDDLDEDDIKLNNRVNGKYSNNDTVLNNGTDVAKKTPFKTETEEKRISASSRKKNVTAKPGTNFYTLNNLKHYTHYAIAIRACQDPNVKSHYCSNSSKASKNKRTKPLPDVDKVQNDTIQYDYMNTTGTVRITWEAPDSSNGGIQGYYVKLMSLSEAAPHQQCQPAIDGNWTSHEDGVIFKGLSDGEYKVEIVAVSMYKSLSEGTIPDDTVVIYTPGFWTLSRIIVFSIFMLIVLVIGSIVGYFTIKKYYGKKVKEIADFMTHNPEYIVKEIYEQDDWELQREDLELLEEIGMGTFGKVYRGVGKDGNVLTKNGERFGECAIKTVQDQSNPAERLHFLLEANVMKTFNSSFIVKLFGVVSTGQPTLCVMEMMALGNLRDYLRSRRPYADENTKNLSPPSKEQYHEWASQIADGMAYLESIKFCHRDLAARNCMVREDETVKIGDFGMARDLYYHDYYKPTGKRLMPVRWMAPESLKDGRFDSKSDCWSYGIVLYEMLTLGQQPYQGLANDEVLNYIGMSRKILDRPKECPEYWYKIMKMCWRYQPRDRPSFAQLVHLLAPHASQEFKEISFVCSNKIAVEEMETDEDEHVEGEDNPDADYVVEPGDSGRLRTNSIPMREIRPCSSRSSSSHSSLMMSSRKNSMKSLMNSSSTMRLHNEHHHRRHSLDRMSGIYPTNGSSTHSNDGVYDDGDYVEKDVRIEDKKPLVSPRNAMKTSNVENDDGYCMSNRNGAMDFPSWGEGDRLTSRAIHH